MSARWMNKIQLPPCQKDNALTYLQIERLKREMLLEKLNL